jgi:CheY-like chemotaxis protein/DNA-binding Xre family transcriptional regulator
LQALFESISVQNDDLRKPFGLAVRIWRDRLGVSQEELAERAGLHRTYISDIERGARNISLASIEKLAAALKVTAAILLSYSGEPWSDKPSSRPLFDDELVDILFAEDNASDVELALRALKHANITNRIHVVRDGEAALNFLFCTKEYSHRRPGDRPQMILLDLGLPKVDGLEVLRRIKADPQTRAIPVVVLTMSHRDRDFIASKQLGAEAYIIKPLDFQRLSEITPQLKLQWALLGPASDPEK